MDSKYKEKDKEYKKKYNKKHKLQKREYQLKYFYGINSEQYNELFIKQKSMCAICGMVEYSIDKRTGSIKSLCVDHCHKTGKIRGLLCASCNVGLGYFRDNPEITKKATKYLLINYLWLILSGDNTKIYGKLDKNK